MTHHSIIRFTLIATTLPWLSSCWFSSPPPAPPITPTLHPSQKSLTIVGRIVSVSPDLSFVLIEREPTTSVPIGTILTTLCPEESRSANLIFTGEAKGYYIAADIQSGTPKVGDTAYLQPPPEPEDTSPDPEDKIPSPPQPEAPKASTPPSE